MMPLIIYHGHCYDGFSAAWVAQKYFNEHEELLEQDAGGAIRGVDFHAAAYETEPPDVKGKDVFILDFSYPRKTLIKINLEAKSLLVLDHHMRAEINLKGLDFCVFDMKRSGAGMTWDHFFPGKPRPLMLNRIEDRDLWVFKFDDTKPAQAYAGIVPMTFEAWDKLMDDELFFTYLDKGEAILEYIAM